MHTVIVNGKQRVVNDEQLRLIKIVYKNVIEYVEAVEVEKVKSKNKKVEDEPIS